MNVSGKKVPGRRSRMCKGPEAGVYLVCLSNTEAPVIEA